MLPLCRDAGIAVMPWSPLARGRLTRDWEATSARSRERRVRQDALCQDRRCRPAGGRGGGEGRVQRGIPRAQVALAWLLQKPGITAPIVGATKLSHLEDAVAALSVTLSDDEIARWRRPTSRTRSSASAEATGPIRSACGCDRAEEELR